MQAKVRCPDCGEITEIEEDLAYWDKSGEHSSQAIDCNCGTTFIVKTTVSWTVETLVVGKPDMDINWSKSKRIKDLLEALERELKI